MNDLLVKARDLCPSFATSSAEPPSIIKIFPVSIKESRSVCLVALTNLGDRLYIMSEPSFGSYAGTFKLTHVRKRPILEENGIAASGTFTSGQVHSGIYTRGLFITIESSTEDIDVLLCTALHSGAYASPKKIGKREIFETVERKVHDGKAWAIEEATSIVADDMAIHRGDELVSQFYEAPRRFLVLSNIGRTTECG